MNWRSRSPFRRRQGHLPSWRPALLGLAFGALAAGCSPGLGGERWLCVRTPHFTLHTDLDPPRAEDMARGLEESRAGLMAVGWQGAEDPRGHTEVAVFADPARFHEFGASDQVGGLAISDVGEERLLAFYWSDERPSGLPTVAVHEIAHDLTRWFTPVQPAWFAEGMASFFEGIEYHGVASHAVLGEVPEGLGRWQKSFARELQSVESLFARRYALHDDSREMTRFYYTSWMLTHYLLNHHGAAFARFQQDLTRLRPWREAWRARLPELTPGALDVLLDEYMRGGRFHYTSAYVDLPFVPLQVRALSPAEGLGVSSRIALRMGNPDLARQRMAAALKRRPHELQASLVQQEFLARQGQLSERRALARRLVRVHDGDGEAWLALARSERRGPARSRALYRARQRLPDHPGVRQLLAVSALREGRRKEALEHTSLLIRRSALSTTNVVLHLQALAANARCQRATLFAAASAALWVGECHAGVGDRRQSCADRIDEALVAVGCSSVEGPS